MLEKIVNLALGTFSLRYLKTIKWRCLESQWESGETGRGQDRALVLREKKETVKETLDGRQHSDGNQAGQDSRKVV